MRFLFWLSVCLFATCVGHLSATELSVRAVSLFKHGVGYFERSGDVRPGDPAELLMRASEMDDVLKSLTVVQTGGEGVASVRYDSADPLTKRLENYAFSIGANAALSDILDQFKGAEAEFRVGGESVRGVIVSARRYSAAQEPGEREELVLASTDGELRVIDPKAAGGVRFLEPGLQDRFLEYLRTVAGARNRDKRRVTIQSSEGASDLAVGYIAPAPIWKSSYRLVLKDDGPALLEGWAIVDNTSGDDWENVRLALVSGLPVSFLSPLYEPVRRERPVVELDPGRLPAPILHAGAVSASGRGSIRGRVTDNSGAAIPGAQILATNENTGVSFQAESGANGRYRLSGLPPGTYRVSVVSEGFRRFQMVGVSVGPDSPAGVNGILEIGAVTEVVEVRAPASRLYTQASEVSVASGSTVRNEFEGEDRGELFEYRIRQPVTIRAGESAMLPFFGDEVAARRLLVYDESQGLQHPRTAVELVNSADSTLDGGAITVYDRGGYAGEALIETLKSGDKRLISYSVDLGVRISTVFESETESSNEVRAFQGVLLERGLMRETKTYTIRNVDEREKMLLIERPARERFEVVEPTPKEKTAKGYRFETPVAPNATKTYRIVEERVTEQRIYISSFQPDAILALIENKKMSPEGVRQLQHAATLRREIRELEREEDRVDEELASLGDSQSRLRQNIATLRALAGQQEQVQTFAAQLAEQEARIEQLNRREKEITEAVDAIETRWERHLEALTF